MKAVLYCRLKLTSAGTCNSQKRTSALRLYQLGMLERQVNPLTAYAMLSVLDVPKGEWLAQACTRPWLGFEFMSICICSAGSDRDHVHACLSVECQHAPCISIWHALSRSAAVATCSIANYTVRSENTKSSAGPSGRRWCSAIYFLVSTRQVSDKCCGKCISRRRRVRCWGDW